MMPRVGLVLVPPVKQTGGKMNLCIYPCAAQPKELGEQRAGLAAAPGLAEVVTEWVHAAVEVPHARHGLARASAQAWPPQNFSQPMVGLASAYSGA
jgi:phage terminase Nu1 subunit (DNA packaging protein)